MSEVLKRQRRAVLLTRYLSDGSIRALWRDEFTPRVHGMRPRRASRIEVVESGPFTGLFYTTMLISQITGDPSHDISLWPPMGDYQDSVRREQQWLERNYVLGEV